MNFEEGSSGDATLIDLSHRARTRTARTTRPRTTRTRKTRTAKTRRARRTRTRRTRRKSDSVNIVRLRRQIMLGK